MSNKKVLFSGIQPSGTLTIGNYMGAFKQWIELQDSYDCIFSVVDLHAITTKQDPNKLHNNILDSLAILIALGIDPKKSVLFVQSTVTEHSQLAWLLNCHTYMGELNRMTQFKDKSAKHKDNINLGLFAYPTLQAADILLYNTHAVPVGSDQKQHLELCRDLANRFNTTYKPIFTIPNPIIPKTGARIMSLQNPLAKMSKSDPNINSYISILDPKDVIIKKFKKAVTDSETIIKYDEKNKPGVSNLLNLLHLTTGESLQSLEQSFAGKGYGDLKQRSAESIISLLMPIQEKFQEIRSDNKLLLEIIEQGKIAAQKRAKETLLKAYDAIGIHF